MGAALQGDSRQMDALRTPRRDLPLLEPDQLLKRWLSERPSIQGNAFGERIA